MFLRLRAAVLVAIHALAVATALTMGSTACNAQAIASGAPEMSPTRLEVYGGYAYFHPLGGTIATRPYQPIQPGLVGDVTGYFNRSLGLQVEGGASPMGPNDSVYTGQAGPVLRYTYGRLSPFVHALGGAARVRGPSQQPPTYGWGLTGGIGLDYVLPAFQRRIAIRPIQADYQFSHVDYGKPSANGMTGGLAEIKAYRLSAGLVLRFGGSLPQTQPLIYSCSASPSQIFAGDAVTVTGSFTGPSTRNRSTYTWEVAGGKVAVTDDTAIITTTGLAPGSYAISGHLSQGKRAVENASCSESFTVMAPIPPTISCTANPVAVRPGGRATITSKANSQQNRPLSFSYSASAGQIASTIAIATLNTGDAPAGPIKVDCRVSDDLGQVAETTTTVNVSAPPAAVAERKALCPLSFARDRRRPLRVDNEAKACLDDVALAMNREATARLILTGETSADETASAGEARAANARSYLTQEKGIDPARIDVKTGSAAGRTVEIELVPIGAPVRYDGTPVSASPSPTSDIGPMPSLQPGTKSTAASDDRGNAGTFAVGPRRSADSLTLPPLPPEGPPHAALRKPHNKSSSVRRRHRRRPPAATVAPSPTTTEPKS